MNLFLWAPPSTAWGRTFLSSPRWPRPWSSACSTTTAPRPAMSFPKSTPIAGTATWRKWNPEPATGIGCTGLISRRPASAATRPNSCSTRTPRRSTARTVGSSPLRLRPRLGRPAHRQDRLRHVNAQGHGRRPGLRLGLRPCPQDQVGRHRHLRNPRQRPDLDPPGSSQEAAGNLRRCGPSGHDRAFLPAGNHRGGADAGTPFHSRPPSGRAGPHATIGVTTRSPTWRPTTGTHPGPATGSSTSSKPW